VADSVVAEVLDAAPRWRASNYAGGGVVAPITMATMR
jgi:hypothetical protein